MTNKTITAEQVDNAADRISTVMKTIELQTNFIDFVPSPHGLSQEDILTKYAYLYKALGNMHELNQALVHDLDTTACLLYDIAEEKR